VNIVCTKTWALYGYDVVAVEGKERIVVGGIYKDQWGRWHAQVETPHGKTPYDADLFDSFKWARQWCEAHARDPFTERWLDSCKEK
jgi:hypothetical protein